MSLPSLFLYQSYIFYLSEGLNSNSNTLWNAS
nr:MAG TPA: hypothetical protein [Bacteriophage sp.]